MELKYPQIGYTKQEAKEYLKNKGLKFSDFIKWMRGQTYSVINGEAVYNAYDVERFKGVTTYIFD